jgi:hypothetical protein
MLIRFADANPQSTRYIQQDMLRVLVSLTNYIDS